MSATIAVLCHDRDSRVDMSRWVINGLANVWREDGHKVVYVYGPRRSEPADVAILHVDRWRKQGQGAR